MKDITRWNCKDIGHFRNYFLKISIDKGKKDVNVAVFLCGVALICCIENSIESWIMDFGASVHACYYRSAMKNFRHYIGKV